MRIIANVVAVFGLCLLCALVYAGGRSIATPDLGIEADDSDDAPDASAAQTGALPAGQQRDVSTMEAPAGATVETTTGAVVDGLRQGGDLERVAPRPPLSDLSLAQQPKPKMPGKWKRITLFQPVAQSAGLIEAKGYRVALSGMDIVEVGQSCSYEGKDWDCGTRARTALRAFMRGRAASCVLPPEPDGQLVVAECQVGNQDLAAWLVEQGWAHARADGPYGDAEKAAEEHKRGIYGPAPAEPSLVGATMPAPRTGADANVDTSIVDETGSAAVDHPDAATGDRAAGDAPATPQVFPPAPSQ